MNNQWDLSRLSFLIVEDNTHMRTILRSILAGLGVRQILEASEGADGLELVMDRQPDFILCDWAMQPVGGAEFIKFLRSEKNATLNTTPIIVVSANSRKATILEARKLGIHGFVAKPVAPATLYQRIANVLTYQAMNGRCRGFLGLNSARKPGKTLDVSRFQSLGGRKGPGDTDDLSSMALL